LDPYIDPYGSLFLLDYTSNKAGKAGAEWFENMYSLGSTLSIMPLEGTDTSRWMWDCLPGWMYARSLAARTLEGNEVAAVSVYIFGTMKVLIEDRRIPSQGSISEKRSPRILK
jgi:hypothetical protein